MALIARIKWCTKTADGGFRWFHPGDEIVGQDSRRDWLLRHNIAVDGEQMEEASPVAAPVVDAEPAEAPEEAAPEVEVKKPRKTDKLAVWQEYAAALKHPYKGKTLDQLKTELG